MNRTVLLLSKVVVVFLIVFLFVGIFTAQNNPQRVIGIVLFSFILLPTLFIVFLKKKIVKNYPEFAIFWKYLIILYVVVLLLIIGYIGLGFYIRWDNDRTKRAIEEINSRKITFVDVMGDHLPPKPDPKINDATIKGVDVNNNAIRDDVELAIFEHYPDSAKIRAAMLQYAQALQLELTKVFNSRTLVGALQVGGRGFSCIGEVGQEVSLQDSHEKILEVLSIAEKRRKEIEGILLNSDIRKKKYSGDINKYTTTYSSLSGEQCDIDVSILPN